MRSLAADDSLAVVVVPKDEYTGFLSRLAAELKIAGFLVHEKSYPVVPAEYQIETSLKNDSAFVFIRDLTRSIELYYRTADGRTMHLNVPIPISSEEEQVTSLHIVEVLRVAFPKPTPTLTNVAPQSSKHPNRKKPSDRLIGHMGVAATFERRAHFPQMGLLMGAGVQFRTWLAVCMQFNVPIRGILLKEPEGDAGLSSSFIGISLQSMFGTRRVRPILQMGYGMWVVHASVQPARGYENAEHTEITSGPYAYIGVVMKAVSRLGLHLGMFVSPTISALSYKMSEREVARLGRPFFGASLGISLLAKGDAK